MTNKAVNFLLEKFPTICELAKEKIQELETTMNSSTGLEKKVALDTYLLGKINTMIESYDISFLPNSLENKFVDPTLEKLIASYLPTITQKIYDIFKAQLQEI